MPEMHDARDVPFPIRAVPERNDARDERRSRKDRMRAEASQIPRQILIQRRRWKRLSLEGGTE
jgi:hypothetical protein